MYLHHYKKFTAGQRLAFAGRQAHGDGHRRFSDFELPRSGYKSTGQQKIPVFETLFL
jgi:hypothetical protein